MTTFATGNPLGSTSVKDLYDNAENFDELLNAFVTSWKDRFGNDRKTWYGFEQDFAQFLLNSGFESVHLTYVDGTPLQVDRPTQLIDRAGSVYRVKLPASFPVMLTGTWATDAPLLLDVGDQSLRTALAAPSGYTLIGEDRYGSNIANILGSLPYYASLMGWGQGGDDTSSIQTLINSLSLSGGGHIVMDCDNDYLVSDSIYVKSNMVISFTGSGFIKATTNTSNGAVLVVYSGDPLAAGRVFDVLVNNPRVNGNNMGAPTLAAGENGVAGTNCERVWVIGGHVKNCRRGSSSATGAGGKGVQFESGVADIKVIGTLVTSCSIACETAGVPNLMSGSTVTQYRVATGVEYDIIARDCGRVVSLHSQFTPPAASETVNCNIKVMAMNCGREDVAGTELDFGVVVFDRYGNGKVQVTLANDSTYGPVYAPIRGRRGVDNDIRVDFIGDCEFCVSHNSTFNSLGSMSGNIFTVNHRGVCNQYALGGPSGESVASANNIWDIKTDVVTLGLVQATWQYTQFNAVFTNQAGLTLEGDLSAIGSAIFGNTYPASTTHLAFAGGLRFNGLTVSYGAGVQVFDSSDDIDLRKSGASKLRVNSTGMIAAVPIYATNAAAITGGLGAGAVYKTSTGELRIVV